MSAGPVDSSLLAHFFTSFVVATACLGGGLVLSRLRQDELVRAFLLLYVPLSALVLSALLLALELTRPFDKSGFRTRVALIAALAGSDQRPGGTR